jgi:hypothetical protein
MIATILNPRVASDCAVAQAAKSQGAAAQYERYQVAPGLVDLDMSRFQRTFAEARDATISAASWPRSTSASRV